MWKSGRPVLTNRQSYSSEAKEIVIPKYIPRGPTDILEVLKVNQCPALFRILCILNV